jgi:hypothetical protein
MAALLEMAEQQFGYDQQGLLNILCSPWHIDHVVNMARKLKLKSKLVDKWSYLHEEQMRVINQSCLSSLTYIDRFVIHLAPVGFGTPN